MDGDHRRKAVPQIPVEYDDLYLQNGYSTQQSFSQDINKQMKVPSRLSVDGKQLHDLEVENMRYDGHNRTAEMAVPDKITLSGASQRGPMDDPYNIPSDSDGRYVAITTPPRVLTVDERFPLIEDSPAVHRPSPSKPDSLPVSVVAPLNLGMDVVEERAMSDMRRRLAQLEALEANRQRREMIMYPALAVYFLFKLINWVSNR